MSLTPKETKALPNWIYEALEEESMDDVLNKRSEPRHAWARLGYITDPDEAQLARRPVKIINVSAHGVGLISRQPITMGEELDLVPEGSDEVNATSEVVRIRVVYCTQTIQGYKVGGPIL